MILWRALRINFLTAHPVLAFLAVSRRNLNLKTSLL
nr:MAG TPA: hypothetical protein [Caudoviricetes sp.]DAM73104.1 MAG TPA: hypothetical protein [Caudoviricetes sp.]